MKRDWRDFKSLYGNLAGAREGFESSCESVFRAVYKDQNVQRVEVRKGDGGIDIYIGDIGISPITVIQCKFFLDEFGNPQHSQIQKSFSKAIKSSKYKVKEWILCIPKVLDFEQNIWWCNWKEKSEGEFGLSWDAIKLYNGDYLIELLEKHKLYNHIFQIETGLVLNDISTKVAYIHSLITDNVNKPKSLLETISSISDKEDKVKTKQALNNYKDNYIRRHGNIKILGMVEPIPLLEIYTSVCIVNPSYINRNVEITNLDRDFRNSRGHSGIGGRTSGLQIANEKQKVNILGAPGSGKSTFLKRLGMEALLRDNLLFRNNTEFYIHESIPVLIELRRFRNEKIKLFEAIQNEFDIAGFPNSGDFVTKGLKSGKFLILLDGLDEVPTNILHQTIDHIADFSDKYSTNRYITSCRTAFYKTYLKNFTDVEIASFNDNQIIKFINNWFRHERDKIADTSITFAKLLFDKNNASALELSRTPLLLTFLCLTFDESQRFPANRSSLYRRALLILLERWAAEKRIHNDNVYQNLSSDLEIEMLAEIAAKFYKEDKIFFYTN